MSAKVLLTGFNTVAGKLYDFSRIHAPLVEGTVGFWAPYAAHVHEDLTKQHPNGQAKFLEDTLKQISFADEVAFHISNGMSMKDAVTKVCDMVINYAKALCPVDTGFLRDSGFVRVQ